jgi:hypothetical protein
VLRGARGGGSCFRHGCNCDSLQALTALTAALDVCKLIGLAGCMLNALTIGVLRSRSWTKLMGKGRGRHCIARLCGRRPGPDTRMVSGACSGCVGVYIHTRLFWGPIDFMVVVGGEELRVWAVVCGIFGAMKCSQLDGLAAVSAPAS